MRILLGFITFIITVLAGYFGTKLWEEEANKEESVEPVMEQSVAETQAPQIQQAPMSQPEQTPQPVATPEVLPEPQPVAPKEVVQTPQASVYQATKAPLAQPEVLPEAKSQVTKEEVVEALPEPQPVYSNQKKASKIPSSNSYRKEQSDSKDNADSLLNTINNLMR